MYRLWLGTIALICFSSAFAGPPTIVKLGTIDCDMVEASPIVFNGKLLRFEYVRENYKPNTTGKPYFRFLDPATGETTPAFAEGHHLGSAFTDGEKMYVYGVKKWGAPAIEVFHSSDLKTWETNTAISLSGWEIFNESVCKGPDGYVMAFEIGAPPEETGVPFTTRFAKSKDLLHWELTPKECVYSKERYTACPSIRFIDGMYYMVHLEAYPGPEYRPHIVRSKDLITWESSPYNPIMKHSDADKKIANSKLSKEQRDHIAAAKNINNSDVDFCEFEGKTTIVYSWGNQQGTEFLAEARYDGTEREFLLSFFPK
jgi:hypothetical protein